MASLQVEGTERLAAWIDECRAAGNSVDHQDLQQRLLKELLALQERWVSLTTQPVSNGAPRGSTSSSLFQVLMQALLAYSGAPANGAASGSSSGMTIPLISSSVATSECVLLLLCELLAKAYDYSSVPVLNDHFTGKHTSLYVKTALVMVIARLSAQDASQFVPEAVAFAHKHVKTADYYLRQCLVESIARMLQSSGTNSSRLKASHGDALKIVGKTFQDKTPDVRVASAGLLHVLATQTSTVSSSSGSGSGAGGASGNGVANGAASTGGANGPGGVTSGPASGGGGVTNGVSLEAIMQTAYKGMDDASPEARRAFSVVVGVVLAKFVTIGSYHVQSNDAEGVSSPSAVESEGGSSHGKSKSMGFKLPGILPASLTRRKGGAASADFSSIASVVLYLKDLVTSKYLATSLSQSQQHHGGILASYSVALCSMFERLPADVITETQLEDIIYAIVSILDHSLSLPDLTRARNAVCFALRHGVNLALSERQQCALLGVYMQIGRQGVDHEAFNHHKVLVVLVETSHLIQSLGEASVVHATEALQVLHGLLAHEKQSLRFQAAIAMASLLTALPYKLKHCLLDCLHSLRDTSTLLLKDSFDAMDSGDEESSTKSKADLYAVQGYSTAIAHVVRAFVLQQSPSGRGGLSHSILSSIMNLAERLIESQFIDGCADSIWLTCTRAGWTLVSSLVTVRDEHWVHTWLRKLSDMWLRTSILHTREASLELLRIEAAVVAMHSFITSCRDALEKSESLQMLMAHVLHAFLLATRTQLAKPQKRRGQIAKHRLVACLMKCFTALPPVFCDSSIHLLDLITEYTTSQSLTNLTHSSSSHPATTTFLRNALSGADEPLEMVSTGRLVPGDDPNVLYSRELNHILALQQHENALSDIEVEIQYLDTFWGLFCESLGGTKNDLYDRAMCSSFTSVRLVDASVFLFGRVFHHLPEDLQLRCLQHFASVLADGRIDCEVNVCALLFAVLKQGKLSKSTTDLSALSWPTQVQSMLLEMVSSENTTIRRGAGEGLGLLASILPESAARNVVQELEKRLRAAEKLPTGTVMVSGANNSNSNPTTVDSSVLAAGASFALACVKRVCGSGITVDSGLIFRFAGEIEQPLRTWILHAWSIIVDSVSASGGDYEQYVKSSASLIEAHLVAGFKYSNKTNKKWLRWHISSQVSIGRIINGVVATLGPELATSGELLTEFYTLWGLLRQDGYDTRVELEYLKFIEQVVVFAPARFDGSDLVYILSLVSDVFVGPALANDAVSPSSVDFVNASSPSSELGDAQSGAFGGVSYPTKNVLVCVNGLARNILQQVGMSCLRTLAERDPGVIRRYNLQCLLFHALHVEWNSLLWRYVPGLHGMWDLLSFKVYVPCKTRDGLGEIQNTILALIDIDGGNWGSCQPCVWALFCRGIAMGESSSNVASTNENLMMSPKGFEMLPIPGSTTDRDGSGWSAGASQPSGKTGTHIATGAVTAQMDTWRRTKRHVRGLLSLVPLLSRQVRRFAVACVVRVFELVSRGGEVDVKPHFDLVEARARFLESISLAAPTASDFHAQQLSHQASDGSTLSGLNYLSMYVDEFVTLACHATTSSAEGNELQIFQCDGLRLLKVVLTKFGNAQDPEVTGETAFLLDPYQAQISSAVRHAVKQAQHSSEDHDDDQDFYAPLAVEAFSLCGESVRSRLVQDKVAFGRLLRMVMTKDYGHSQHFAGDEVTRVAISLANLSCLANLVVSSLDAPTDATSSPSSLAKALTSNISGAVLDHIIACWLDATACYGLLMEGSGPWPVALLPVSHDHRVVQSSVLKLSMPVSPPQLTSLPPQTSSPTVDALREIFKRFWPAFPLAVVSLLESNAVNAAAFSGKLEMVLSYCVFHVATGARDRQESEIVPVLRAMPRLLMALKSSLQIADFMTSSLAALMFASTHAYGTIRIECLTSLFGCLQSITPLPQAAVPFGAQAALCPFQILAQIADPAKHRLSIGGRDDAVFIPEILRFAATGVVFLRGHNAVRASVFDALPLVDRCTEFFVHHPEHMVPFAAVHRGVIESAITLLKAYGSSEEGEYYVEAISNSLGLTTELLQTAVAEEPVVEYQVDAANAVFKLVANVAVPMTPSLSHVATAFHGVVTTCVSRLLTQEIHDTTDTRRDGLIAALIGGVRGVSQRLVDNGDVSNAQRYLGSLAPISIAIFDSYTLPQGTPIHVDGIREVEQWIRLLSTQLAEIQGAAFVRLMLPKLATMLAAVETQPHDVKAAVSTSLADLLLCFAQTRAAAFKEVVGAIAPSQRTVLETSLRAALTAGTTTTARGGAVASTGTAGNGVGGSTLDLSRYK